MVVVDRLVGVLGGVAVSVGSIEVLRVLSLGFAAIDEEAVRHDTHERFVVLW